jgi:hypothetical protein
VSKIVDIFYRLFGEEEGIILFLFFPLRFVYVDSLKWSETSRESNFIIRATSVSALLNDIAVIVSLSL